MSLQFMTRKALILICGFFFSYFCIAEEDAPANIRVAGVPAGFQFLLEKQTTAVDVFFGDVFLTTTMASYTPTTIEFHSPGDITATLSNLLTPEEVASGLSGELDSHVGEICYRATDKDCGNLAPEKVGVIFDENQFRADIFINPNLLAIQQRSFNRFLPEPDPGFSYMNNLSLVYSGDSDGSDQTGLNGNSFMSWGRHRVVALWGANDAQDTSNANVEMLYWQFDHQGLQYQAGWFRSESRFLSFVPSVDLLGFRFSTSLKARTDLDYAKGTPIELFLPTRSRINIYKDGRFITADFYEPGNQEIDTSKLPDGAYEIELQIIGSSGEEKIINRFYVKSPRIAPMDEPQYFIEAGDIQTNNADTKFPESRDIPILQAGYSQRLLTNLGLNVGVAMTDSDLVTEAGVYYVMDQFDIEPKILLGADGEYGYTLTGFMRYYDFSTAYQFRQIWTDHVVGSPDDFYLIPAARKQHNISISYPLFDGQLQLRLARSETAGKDSSKSTALTYSRLLPWFFEGGNFRLSTEISDTDGDKVVMFRLGWNVRDNAWYHNVYSELRSEDRVDYDKQNLFRAGYSGSWNDEDILQDDLTVNWRAQADDNTSTLGVSSSLASELGRARLAVDYQGNKDSGSRMVYVGEASSSVAGDADTVAIGGKSLSQSALIVEIAEADTDSIFKLYINSALYGYLKPGKRVVVPVSPYQRYDVSLRDIGDEFVTFEKNNRKVVLYPGNVKHLLWKPRTLLVMVAKIARPVQGCLDRDDPECWYPMVNARANGVYGFSRTDANGFLQAEVLSGTKRIIFTHRDYSCVVDLPQIKPKRNILFYNDDLHCVPESELPPLE